MDSNYKSDDYRDSSKPIKITIEYSDAILDRLEARNGYRPEKVDVTYVDGFVLIRNNEGQPAVGCESRGIMSQTGVASVVMQAPVFKLARDMLGRSNPFAGMFGLGGSSDDDSDEDADEDDDEDSSDEDGEE